MSTQKPMHQAKKPPSSGRRRNPSNTKKAAPPITTRREKIGKALQQNTAAQDISYLGRLDGLGLLDLGLGSFSRRHDGRVFRTSRGAASSRALVPKSPCVPPQLQASSHEEAKRRGKVSVTHKVTGCIDCWVQNAYRVRIL